MDSANRPTYCSSVVNFMPNQWRGATDDTMAVTEVTRIESALVALPPLLTRRPPETEDGHHERTLGSTRANGYREANNAIGLSSSVRPFGSETRDATHSKQDTAEQFMLPATDQHIIANV